MCSDTAAKTFCRYLLLKVYENCALLFQVQVYCHTHNKCFNLPEAKKIKRLVLVWLCLLDFCVMSHFTVVIKGLYESRHSEF